MIPDIIVLLVLVLAVYRGWTKGFIMSVFVFLSYFIALALAFHLSGKVAGYFKESAGSDSKWYSFLAFLAVMIGAVILIRLLGKLIEKTVELMLLGVINRILGIAIFGFLYTGLLAVAIVYLNKYGLVGDDVLKNSKTGQYLVSFGNWTIIHFTNWLPEMKNLFNNSNEFIQQNSNSLTS